MSDPQTTPTDRIRIFSREGIQLSEFRASVSRSVLIGEEGRAAFTYPSRKTQVVNKDNLRFGNWLLIENSHLPPWVGVIDYPREWSAREVTVTAYTPERVFGWRRGPLEEVVTGSAGAIFERLLYFVNLAEATVIRAGELYRGGAQMEETLNPTTLDESLHRIYERSGQEYQFRPTVSANGQLTIYADWRQTLGEETGIILQEGRGGGNIEAVDNVLVEDGPILNDLFAVGDGESWTSRPVFQVRDAVSIGDHALRQDSEEFAGVTNMQTLRDNGLQRVSQFKDPVNAYQINALHVGDTFAYLRLGNRFKLRFESVGFSSGGTGFERSVRIVAMAYDPDVRNKVNLVVEDV